MDPKNAVLITLLTSHNLHWFFFSERFIRDIAANVANSPDKLAEANPGKWIHKKQIFQCLSRKKQEGHN